jgi:hypothetical protein
MTAKRSGQKQSEDPPNSAEGAAPPRPPRFISYVLLNLGVWIFLILQAALLSALLESESRMVVLITILLALGFTAVSIFDYVYLRSTRR